jgi:hypothetical protein
MNSDFDVVLFDSFDEAKAFARFQANQDNKSYVVQREGNSWIARALLANPTNQPNQPSKAVHPWRRSYGDRNPPTNDKSFVQDGYETCYACNGDTCGPTGNLCNLCNGKGLIPSSPRTAAAMPTLSHHAHEDDCDCELPLGGPPSKSPMFERKPKC